MGMGVAVGGKSVWVAVGEGSVAEASTDGKSGVFPEQAVNVSRKRIKIRFSVHIYLIIPETAQLKHSDYQAFAE